MSGSKVACFVIGTDARTVTELSGAFLYLPYSHEFRSSFTSLELIFEDETIALEVITFDLMVLSLRNHRRIKCDDFRNCKRSNSELTVL